MKINKILILLILGFLLKNLRAMEWKSEEETEEAEITLSDTFASKESLEYQQLLEKIEKMPLKIQVKILKRVLTKNLTNIEEGIEFIQSLSGTILGKIISKSTFINWAIRTIVKVLNKSSVEAALKLGIPGASEWLKEKAKTNPEIKAEIDQKLIKAAMENLQTNVRFLLDSGANPNICTSLGLTPLMKTKDENIAKLLLESGAKIDVKDKFGNSVLHWSVWNNGNEKLVELLIKNNAEVNIQNNTGSSVLHWSILKGSEELVKLLLKNKANVNVQTGTGITPLMMAANEGYEGIVRVLLEYGADINLKNVIGQTAAAIASSKGYKSIENLILSHGTK